MELSCWNSGNNPPLSWLEASNKKNKTSDEVLVLSEKNNEP